MLRGGVQESADGVGCSAVEEYKKVRTVRDAPLGGISGAGEQISLHSTMRVTPDFSLAPCRFAPAGPDEQVAGGGRAVGVPWVLRGRPLGGK